MEALCACGVDDSEAGVNAKWFALPPPLVPEVNEFELLRFQMRTNARTALASTPEAAATCPETTSVTASQAGKE